VLSEYAAVEVMLVGCGSEDGRPTGNESTTTLSIKLL
jgi:hypothetical protein